MKQTVIVISVIFTVCACGGGDNGGPIDLSGMDLADTAGQDPADAGPDAKKYPVTVEEDFRYVYGYAGRIPGVDGNLGDFDLFLADPADADPSNDQSLTEESLKEHSLDCDLGCFMDREMRWLAVVTGMAESDDICKGTYKLMLARFTPKLTLVPLDKFGGLECVKHLQFEGDYLYFSQPQQCEAVDGIPVPCYVIKRLDLNSPGVIQTLLTMPTKELIAKSQGYQYYGYFTVGQDKETIIFMLPTNVSQSVWLWRNATLSKVVKDLCAATDPAGNCIGSGTSSLYHDNDPVALSPDGKHLIFALVEDNAELRIYHYDIGLGPEFLKWSVLLGVHSDFFTNACYNRALWQYTDVDNPMMFTPDGKDIVFLGSHTCGDNQQKPWTNIVRLALDSIGAGVPLTEADFRLVTDNPEGNIAKAVSITWFDLSPSGEYTVFTGTPTIEADGSTLITDTSARHYKDLEVYVTATDGTTLPVQLTNNLEWEAVSVLAIPTPE